MFRFYLEFVHDLSAYWKNEYMQIIHIIKKEEQLSIHGLISFLLIGFLEYLQIAQMYNDQNNNEIAEKDDCEDDRGIRLFFKGEGDL